MKKILSLLLSFFLITCNAFAEVKWVKASFFNNNGGMNDAFSPIAIEDNEASDLQNVVFTTSGNWKTRGGSAKLNSTTLGASVICTGIKYYKPTSGTKYLIGVFDDDKIRKMDYQVGGGPDGTWDDITGSLSFAITGNNLSSFAIGEDTLIIEDGLNTTAPYKWTGSGNAVALSGSPPNATLVAYHKRMGFAAGNNTNPSTLYFTDVGNIENWTTGLSGNVSIETNDGSVIRAIVPGFDALYIWKDYSIWRLSGDDKDTFQLQRMISNVGTLSPKSISRIGNDFFFVSSQGDIYIYDGAIGIKLISTKIQGTIDGANFNRFQYVVGELFDKDYYLAFSTSSNETHNRILSFDTFHLAWTKFVGINANVIAVADDGTGKDMLVFGDYGGFVYKYPSGTNDAGTAIETIYTTKQFYFPELSPQKDWKLLKVFANQKGNYNLVAEMRKDFETTGTTESISLAGSGSLWGTAVFGVDAYGGQNLIIGRVEVNKEGDFYQIKFSNSNLDEPVEVKGWEIYLEQGDRV
ncbi:MAG: hypothetical protein QME16_00110 [Planctomycetota bacterium]|nr:hypothetical protein [Planctomycetota bacterium]